MNLIGPRADRAFDLFTRAVVVFTFAYLAAHVLWAVAR